MYLGELPSLIQSFAYFDQRWGLAIAALSIVCCMDTKENKTKFSTMKTKKKKRRRRRIVEKKGRADSQRQQPTAS